MTGNLIKNEKPYTTPETFTIEDVVEALEALRENLPTMEIIPMLFDGLYDPKSKVFEYNVSYLAQFFQTAQQMLYDMNYELKYGLIDSLANALEVIMTLFSISYSRHVYGLEDAGNIEDLMNYYDIAMNILNECYISIVNSLCEDTNSAKPIV